MIGVPRIAVLLCLCASFGLQAAVYKWVDENGRTHFGDRPPQTKQKQSVEVVSKDTTAPSPNPGVAVGSSGSGAQGAKSDYRHPTASDTLRIRKLFEDEDFAQLNQVLDNRLQAVRRDIGKESELWEAYQVFQQDDPAWNDLFDRWVASYPAQYQGYLARATYQVHRGWKARGGAYINKTPEENVTRMLEFMDLAQSDLTWALRLETDALWAYCLRINVAKARGNSQDALRSLEQAVRRYPDTYLARKYYLETLDPKWGGSLLAMVSFANNAQHRADSNPKLRQLASYAYYESGRMAYIDKEYAKAQELLTAAINKEGRPRSYFLRGKTHARLGNHDKALADFNVAINLEKEDGDYYYWRARSFAALKHYRESFRDIQRAYALKPGDEYINKFRLTLAAHTLTPEIAPMQQGADHSGRAESLFRQAKVLIEDNQPEQARRVLERAIDMQPDEFRYYQLVDYALFKQGKTRDILGYWETYLTIKPNDDRAYLERAGTHYHLQDFDAAKADAKRAMDMGNDKAERFYQQLQALTDS